MVGNFFSDISNIPEIYTKHIGEITSKTLLTLEYLFKPNSKNEMNFSFPILKD